MQIEVLYRPSYSLALIKLAPNEEIRIEAGAMVSMSQGVTIETKAAGGFFKSLSRTMLGGESFFQNFFKAPAQGGEITVAPELPGDVFTYDMSGETLMVQSGSFMACETTIELNTKLSIKAFVAAEGFSMLEASGTGKLLLSSYGAIHEKVLAAGEKYTVDTTHLVAFPASMPVERKTVGGLKSTLLSGEGLVVELTGPGRLLMQTRSPHAFLSWLIPNLPFKRQGES
ncbi:MAG TPA: TIGR00266 family protein [Anaerolineales bacterium]